MAQGLDHAHGQGILHRDIKPSNLLLDVHGTVWVTDFGLAKAEGQADLTDTGDIIGTLRYMPPEAFHGQADARSDLYSLGLTLYELLALKPAFNETFRQKLIKQVTDGTPEPLDRVDPRIPRDLRTIVQKTIEQEPAHRYQTAQELADDLQRYLDDEPIRARRISAAARFRRWCKRNIAIASLTSTIALLLLTTAIVSGFAAARFRKLANENMSLAIAEAAAYARSKASFAQSDTDRKIALEAEAIAKSAQATAERQSKQLEANVDLGLDALGYVFQQYGEQRLLAKGELSAGDRKFMEKAFPFYTSFSKQKRETPETELASAQITTRIGSIQHRLKQYDQSEPALVQAVALWEKVVENEPDSISHRASLAGTRATLGHTLRDKQDFKRAIPVHRQVIEDYSGLMQDAPDNPEYHRLLTFAWRYLGIALNDPAQREQRKKSFPAIGR